MRPPQDSQPVQEAATAAEAPAPTAPITNASLQAVVAVEVLNVRVAPDISAAIAQQALTNGTQIELVGRSEDNLWFATPLASGGVGWVFGDPLTVQGDPTPPYRWSLPENRKTIHARKNQ